ncbi:MAG TPA: hypothetical protein VE737_02640 [Actinomycetota bacterium]|nr:hypothetical protein [Actinomycetota bacterium]
MAGKEILYQTFFTKAPGQEKLRKTAQGRLKTLLGQGWHEVARDQAGPDSFRIRFEREGATRPLPPLRTKPEPPPRREGRRGGPGGFGGRGGPGGRGAPGGGRGAPGGGRGVPRRGQPGAQPGGSPPPQT